MDIPGFLECVVRGLSDQNDIQMLSFMTIERLAIDFPEYVLNAMEKLTKELQKIIVLVPASNATPQEKEKSNELQRASLKSIIALKNLSEKWRFPRAGVTGSEIDYVTVLMESVRKSTNPLLKKRLLSIEDKDKETNTAMDTTA